MKYLLKTWHICWDTLVIERTRDWNIMPKYRVELYLIIWDKIESSKRTKWWCYLSIAGRTVKIIEYSQVHTFFFQVGRIDNCTNITIPVAQYSVESEYNAAFNAGISLVNFRMLNNELMNKRPYLVSYQAPLIILDSNSALFMANNGKYTKHTRYISEEWHL